ncbi:chorismate synthase [Clostridium amylolyticum]|uniref:Chorismate synthase n=1 Tax=Clostridium amylolyticum TaxID=1121298 RepID=A0A1M6MMV9_9CLOT|nr:chorismate synthase [Clostridium amylolyticum]SHJ84720.1 chorismate synthase [Clostridium amylolyticum]
MLRFLDGGESHGKALTAIIDGFPSNFDINIEEINNELYRRQLGYGRGKRMNIEKDNINIWSGVRGNITTGNPLTFIIYNKDYENWKELINNKPKEEEAIFTPRPGHGDLVGFFKYKTGDIRDVIERTSARETAIRTAVGALCKQMLAQLNIEIRSQVIDIGGIKDSKQNLFHEETYKIIENSEVRCFSKDMEEKIKYNIDKAAKEGETLGGSIYVSIGGMFIGLGSYTQWDKKLDSILCGAVMSLQGIKAVEIGDGLSTSLKGTNFNDEIYLDKAMVKRKTNHCGGIEAGVSNGENIEITAYMKAIPSVKKGISTIDLNKKINVTSRYERSDVCAVVPASVVIENICAYEILNEILKVFPCCDFNSLKEALNKHRNYIKKYMEE